MEYINELIELVLKVLVIPVIGVLVSYIAQLIITKINFIKNKELRDRLIEATEELKDKVLTAVDTVSQTYVNDLKSSGEFTIENQKKALVNATDLALSMISKGSLEYLTQQLSKDGLSDLTVSLVEQAIYRGHTLDANNTILVNNKEIK